jgi:uncharacterized protein YfaS (alpha-2-macroglobulin family)
MSRKKKSKGTTQEGDSVQKVNVTLPGTVEKIIPAVGEVVPEKAQIQVEGADELYREIRIENKLQDPEGKPVSLKKGDEVDVTIEADPNDPKPKE